MKKNNVVTLLGIALAVAIVATGIFYGLFVNKLSSSTGSGRTLVVAARTLKAGTVIKDVDIKTIPWPAEQVPKGGFEKVTDVTGSTVFDTIAEDEPVMSGHLSNNPSAPASPTAPPNGVPPGMRAVSVHVADSTGVLALLRSGHRVDVQVVTHRDGGQTEVRTAIQNLEVFSVSPQAEPSSQGANAPVVTLLAKPGEADILAAADAGARIRLTLRNPQDQETRGRAALSLDTVMREPLRANQ